MSKKDEPLPESRALESILRGSGSHTSHPSSSTTSTTQFFFETIYQNACVVFPSTVSSSSGGDPYTELVSNGWEALIQLLESSRKAQDEQTKRRDAHATPDDPSESPAGTVDDQLLPLLFQNQINLGPNASDRYNHSLFAAYLDGCSVVNNHADQLSPHIAALCHDLQQSFPHVYANTYLTPPNQQAVPAHADDRDVFVIQILGRKEWTVYETIPIPYPYPDEQVGKDNLTVPEQVLQGPVAIQHVLEAGNVLYMPRGFVHQARALPGEMSFHVTIALATQDWSVAGILTNATAQILHTTVEYRKAVDRNIGARNWNRMPIESKEQTKQLLDQVFDRLREQVTVKSIHQALNTKYSRHNERAWQKRKLLIQQLRDGHGTLYHDVKTVVGREASERVRFDMRLRLATEKEKASLPSSSSASTATWIACFGELF